MKTILIVIAGMGDMPDPATGHDTPLATAHIPGLHTLARRGELALLPVDSDTSRLSHKNALLSLLGYELERGEPSSEELMEFGLDHSSNISNFASLRPFILPGFSSHGVCVTTSAWVRGVAKCALLTPKDIYSPGSADAEILETMARLAVEAIEKEEFVLLYVDTPLKASLRGDYQAKIRALEEIDRHLVTPVADFVWKSELFIQLAVTSDLITPWHRRRPTVIGVPAILYFNNFDTEGDPDLKFTEVNAMLSPHKFNDTSDLIRFLINFNVYDDEVTQ